MKKFILITLLSSFCIGVYAQSGIEKGLAVINKNAIKGQLEFFASDWMEGRAVGTKGADLAADYIASMYQVYGLSPLGDDARVNILSKPLSDINISRAKRYFQKFRLVEYEKGDHQELSVISKHDNNKHSLNFNFETDFDVETGSVGVSAYTEVAFVGYGYSNPNEGYDDLGKIDLKGKIALVLVGYPGHTDSSSVAYKKFYKGNWFKGSVEKAKNKRLIKMGAVAIIKVNLDSDETQWWAKNEPKAGIEGLPNDIRLINHYYDKPMIMAKDTIQGDVPIFWVTDRVANKIVENTKINLSKFEDKVKNELSPSSKILKGKSVEFHTTVNSRVVVSSNVLGYIEGENQNEAIVIGAHYDHVGKSNGLIFNGADDNASGTVGMLSIARAFHASGVKPKKSIIFAAWGSEENGLHGSKYFVDNIPENLKVLYNLNFDMIGRDSRKDTAGISTKLEYSEAYPALKAITEKMNNKYDLGLTIDYKPSKQSSGGSDHASFANAGIPISFFISAMHDDYHMPSDEADKINWDKLTKITKLGFLKIWHVANKENFFEDKK